MATATKLDKMGQLLDALSRARVLLLEHRDLPPVALILASARVDIDVASVWTFSEETRRHAVDVLASAARLGKPTIKTDQVTRRLIYVAENDAWRIWTAVKGQHCESCGGAIS